MWNKKKKKKASDNQSSFDLQIIYKTNVRKLAGYLNRSYLTYILLYNF